MVVTTLINKGKCILHREDGHYSTVLNPLNAEFNPICNLLALLGAHHILHISRIRVNNRNRYQNNLLALLGAHHILHISRIRVNNGNRYQNNLLALLGAHHILHISRIRLNNRKRYQNLGLQRA